VNISAATYVFRVKKIRTTTYVKLSNINGDDFYEFLYKFIQERSAPHHDLGAKTILSTKKLDSEGRTIQGFFESGVYGYATTGRNSKTLKKSYTRGVDDAEMMPFYFFVDIPRNSDAGLLLLQRFGVYGVYSAFVRLLKHEFRPAFPGHVLEIEQIIHPDLVTKFSAESRAQRVTFRKYEIPRDSADKLPNNFSKNCYMEVSYVAKRHADLGSVTDWLRGQRKLTGLLSTLNFEPDETLVGVTLNRQHRLLRVNDLSKIQCYFDISNKVKMGIDGHPKEEDLKREFKALGIDLWRELTAQTISRTA
jgi:hypothetical protein